MYAEVQTRVQLLDEINAMQKRVEEIKDDSSLPIELRVASVDAIIGLLKMSIALLK